MLAMATVLGFIGYLLLGLDPLEALYQTVITGTTVGYREVGEVTVPYQLFTIVFIFIGVGSALYALSVLFETIVEGRLDDLFGRRRMVREIGQMQGHVVLCGAGRVGRVLAGEVASRGVPLVVIDSDSDRLAAAERAGGIGLPGDARSDDTLREAGIERAGTLVAALASDADNVYVTLGARALNPGLFIVSRAHQDDAEPKLRHAGADRVVNPQAIGGQRMATFALQPNVAEFLDVVMHDDEVAWRLEEIEVGVGSELSDQTLEGAALRRRCGAMVLALRRPGGQLMTNPHPDTELVAGTVLIAMGTSRELAAVEGLAAR